MLCQLWNTMTMIIWFKFHSQEKKEKISKLKKRHQENPEKKIGSKKKNSFWDKIEMVQIVAKSEFFFK